VQRALGVVEQARQVEFLSSNDKENSPSKGGIIATNGGIVGITNGGIIIKNGASDEGQV
jgi:hypothetical protein